MPGTSTAATRFCGISSCQAIHPCLPPLNSDQSYCQNTVSDSRDPQDGTIPSNSSTHEASPNDCLFMAPLRPLSRLSLGTPVLSS